jgi:mono/diheme cytochrome c family protein
MITLGVTCLIIGAAAARRPAGPDQGQMPMRGMMHRMMPDLVPPGVEPEDLPDPHGRGARLLVRYCGQCHNLPSPSMHSAGEWPAIAERMDYRMEMMSGMMGIESPSSNDRAAILDYLKTYAMKSVAPESLPAGQTPGAVVFKAACSQCHALPDPKSYAAGRWPAIVEKMKANMRLMRKKAITADQEKEILRFLEQHAKKG